MSESNYVKMHIYVDMSININPMDIAISGTYFHCGVGYMVQWVPGYILKKSSRFFATQ